MDSDLTERTLNHDRYFGKRIISCSVSPHRIWEDAYIEKQLVPRYGYIVKNKDDKYGFVSGGNNNISAFVGWCTGKSSWCFNPINMDNYIWSEINEAFINKNLSCIKEVRLLPGKFYYYREDRETRQMFVLFSTWLCFNKHILWERNTTQS